LRREDDLALSQIPAIMSTVEDVMRRSNPGLEVSGFLPTMFDNRTRHTLTVLEQIAVQAKRFGTHGFKPVPKTIRVSEATSSGRPLSTYAPNSPAALAYEDLAAQIELESALKESPSLESVSTASGGQVGQREPVAAART
jgi:chromosome partitioning protein